MWGVSFIGELKPILLNSVMKYFSQLQSTIILWWKILDDNWKYAGSYTVLNNSFGGYVSNIFIDSWAKIIHFKERRPCLLNLFGLFSSRKPVAN